jgi:hypothetical protein
VISAEDRADALLLRKLVQLAGLPEAKAREVLWDIIERAFSDAEAARQLNAWRIEAVEGELESFIAYVKALGYNLAEPEGQR